MRSLFGRVTFANVVATLALFLALGGGAYAATQALPKSTVGATQLKPGAVGPEKLDQQLKEKIENVQSAQLATGSVTSAKLGKEVKEQIQHIKGSQLEAATISEEKLAKPLKEKVDTAASQAASAAATKATPGPRGEQGPEGKQGKPGEPGKAGTPASGLWAFVDGGGHLVSGEGVSSVEEPEPGAFVVVFDREVADCSLQATAATTAFDDGVSTSPTVGETAVARLDGNADGVVVSRGEEHGNPAELPFYLTVLCS